MNPHRPPQFPVEIVAHRGGSALAPENTLGAVKQAWEMGADAVEVDVQLSADGQLVVIHDETLERTAGRADRVDDLTAKELSQVDVGSWFSPEWAGESVERLMEFLTVVPDGKRILVELKCGDGAVEALAAPLEEVADSPEKVVLIGFDRDLLSTVKQRYPAHHGFLVARQQLEADTWTPSVGELIDAAIMAGLDGLDLLNTVAVDQVAVRQIHEAGLSCCVWPVKMVEDARRLIDAGVDAVTTDNPRLLFE